MKNSILLLLLFTIASAATVTINFRARLDQLPKVIWYQYYDCTRRLFFLKDQYCHRTCDTFTHTLPAEVGKRANRAVWGRDGSSSLATEIIKVSSSIFAGYFLQ